MHEYAYSLFTVNFRDTSVSGPLLSKPPDEDPGLALMFAETADLPICYSRRLLSVYVTPVTYVEKGVATSASEKRSMEVSRRIFETSQPI
jgi:hypothetical protein